MKLVKFLSVVGFLSCVSHSLFSEGFEGGTLVKVPVTADAPTGYKTIEQLQVGEKVITTKSNDYGDRDEGVVTAKEYYFKQGCLTFSPRAGGKIKSFTCSPDQKIWICGEWQKAENLTKGFSSGDWEFSDSVPWIGVASCDKDEFLYKITVDPGHSFFITDQDIRVHNSNALLGGAGLILFSVGAQWGGGATVLSVMAPWAIAAALASAGGMILLEKKNPALAAKIWAFIKMGGLGKPNMTRIMGEGSERPGKIMGNYDFDGKPILTRNEIFQAEARRLDEQRDAQCKEFQEYVQRKETAQPMEPAEKKSEFKNNFSFIEKKEPYIFGNKTMSEFVAECEEHARVGLTVGDAEGFATWSTRANYLKADAGAEPIKYAGIQHESGFDRFLVDRGFDPSIFKNYHGLPSQNLLLIEVEVLLHNLYAHSKKNIVEETSDNAEAVVCNFAKNALEKCTSASPRADGFAFVDMCNAVMRQHVQENKGPFSAQAPIQKSLLRNYVDRTTDILKLRVEEIRKDPLPLARNIALAVTLPEVVMAKFIFDMGVENKAIRESCKEMYRLIRDDRPEAAARITALIAEMMLLNKATGSTAVGMKNVKGVAKNLASIAQHEVTLAQQALSYGQKLATPTSNFARKTAEALQLAEKYGLGKVQNVVEMVQQGGKVAEEKPLLELKDAAPGALSKMVLWKSEMDGVHAALDKAADAQDGRPLFNCIQASEPGAREEIELFAAAWAREHGTGNGRNAVGDCTIEREVREDVGGSLLVETATHSGHNQQETVLWQKSYLIPIV